MTKKKTTEKDKFTVEYEFQCTPDLTKKIERIIDEKLEVAMQGIRRRIYALEVETGHNRDSLHDVKSGNAFFATKNFARNAIREIVWEGLKPLRARLDKLEKETEKLANLLLEEKIERLSDHQHLDKRRHTHNACPNCGKTIYFTMET